MDKIQQFWDEFCSINKLNGIHYKEAFQFGVLPDLLASLVIEGKKTATTSGYIFYELENEALPKSDDYAIVLNGNDEPVAIIRTDNVEVLPMNEVSEQFALAEGEGDYKYWWESHEKFFTDLLLQYGRTFTPNMLVVCERFTNVYSK